MELGIDQTSRILPLPRTMLGKESGSCSVHELSKCSRALSICYWVPDDIWPYEHEDNKCPRESTWSSPPLGNPVTQRTEWLTDLTADEIEYLITELKECRKKTKIFEEKLENKNRLKRELIIEHMRFAETSVFQFYFKSNLTIHRKD